MKYHFFKNPFVPSEDALPILSDLTTLIYYKLETRGLVQRITRANCTNKIKTDKLKGKQRYNCLPNRVLIPKLFFLEYYSSKMVSTDWSSSFGYLSRMDKNIILPKENYFRNTICPACLDLTYASIALNEPGINSDVKSPLHINRTNAINISSVGWMRRTPS